VVDALKRRTWAWLLPNGCPRQSETHVERPTSSLALQTSNGKRSRTRITQVCPVSDCDQFPGPPKPSGQALLCRRNAATVATRHCILASTHQRQPAIMAYSNERGFSYHRVCVDRAAIRSEDQAWDTHWIGRLAYLQCGRKFESSPSHERVASAFAGCVGAVEFKAERSC
jgi:hypothetical protein